MKKNYTLILTLFFFGSMLYAQQEAGDGPVLGVVEYLDDSFEARIILDDGSEVVPDIGLELTGGTVIQTYMTTLEIRLTAGGSLLRLAEDTIFRLEARRVTGDERVDAYTLAAGTLRCVAARLGGQGYAVHSPSAIMGVRGTDFVVEAGPEGETLSVLDGTVEALHRAGNRFVMVGTGYYQDLRDENAVPRALDEDLRDLLVRMNSFKALDPADVVHQSPEPGTVDLIEESGEVTPEKLKELREKTMVRPEREIDYSVREVDDKDETEDSKMDKSPSTTSRGTEASSEDTQPTRSRDDETWNLVLSAGIHPNLATIAESTWSDLLGLGGGGSVSLTAGFDGIPAFYGGLTGGVYALSGKAGYLERSLWVPIGMTGGIRRDIDDGLALYGAVEGGMQYIRFTYSLAEQPAIEGWAPYVLARLGLRYDLAPLVFEGGAAFGSAFEGSLIPFVRVELGLFYEVRL